jgi:hypothetical protein
MPRRENHLSPDAPEPAATTPDAADSIGWPTDTTPFASLTDEQAVPLWAELADSLSGLDALARRDGIAAMRKAQQAAESLITRLGLSPSLAKLFWTELDEARELEAIVTAGEGQAEKAESIRRDLQSYGNLAPASDIMANRAVAQERERLSTEWLADNRLAEAAIHAARGLRHLHAWTPQLFGLPDWTKERDEQNRIRNGAGRLSSTIPPTRTAQVAGELSVDPYVPDSWRQLKRPEPTGPRRRFRTSPLSQPNNAPISLGRQF